MSALRRMLHSKIHRLKVTEANEDYEGSITLSSDLLNAAGILAGEAVWIWDVTNGNRLETYTIEAPAGSQEVCINGAAAKLIKAGDIVIVAAFCWKSEEQAKLSNPVAVFVDENNKITEIRKESVAMNIAAKSN